MHLMCRNLELVGVLFVQIKSTIYASVDDWALNPQHLRNPLQIELRSTRFWVYPKDFNLELNDGMINTLERENEAQ